MSRRLRHSPRHITSKRARGEVTTMNSMNATDILIWNVEEVRRRSVIVWRGIPAERATWKVDDAAMTCIEMVRHVLEGEFLYTEMLKARRSVPDEPTPFTDRPFTTIEAEIAFAAPFRAALISVVRSFEPGELKTVTVDR